MIIFRLDENVVKDEGMPFLRLLLIKKVSYQMIQTRNINFQIPGRRIFHIEV